MGINIKYYIISIAAIFISLGIGIFIGFNMNGQEIYLKQQQILVDSLEDRFAEFKKDKEDLEQNIQDLNVEKEKQNIFIGNIFYEIIHEKLVESNIAIIETADYHLYDDINETLKLAGASIPIYVKYMEKIYDVKQEQLQEINDLTGEELKSDEDLMDLINNEVVNSFVSRNVNDILNFFIDYEYIQYNCDFSELGDLNIDGFIITGGIVGSQEYKVEQLNETLIRNLLEHQFRIIGVERLDVEQSHIPIFKELNISTIDNIDNRMGKISLVYLLEGARGHYGEKLTADSLAPFIVINPGEE